MKKRDRRLTPTSTSLAAGWSEAVPESTELKADTASAFYLDGKGTSREKESKDIAKVIPKEISKPNKSRKDKRNNYRVPVLNPDGTPAMPTINRRANRWIREKRAKVIKNKLGIFQIQLLKEPSGRNKQDIVGAIDPGSAFTGIAIISKKAVLYGATLELPGYKKDSKPKIVVNRFGKKIEKYHNTIIEGMDKRRQLRRSRRHRNCRRRPARWLNRSKSKIPPSILSRKQLELKVIKELSNIYPISMIGFEDIKFNHFKDKEGVKGQFFSHVEIGKNWILDRLKKIAPIRIIRGYETNIRREQSGLKKEKDKTVRNPESHVNDCIAMGSIILGLGIEMKNKFKFDTITRPKYSRRILHLEQPGKGGIRRKYGGSTVYPLNWTKFRKGDYIEAIQGNKVFRGWVSGFIDDKRIVSVSDFDWKRTGQFGESNVRLLDRNHGLLIRSLYMEKERINVCSSKLPCIVNSYLHLILPLSTMLILDRLSPMGRSGGRAAQRNADYRLSALKEGLPARMKFYMKKIDDII